MIDINILNLRLLANPLIGLKLQLGWGPKATSRLFQPANFIQLASAMDLQSVIFS